MIYRQMPKANESAFPKVQSVIPGGVNLGNHTLQPASVRASPASECALQAVAPPVGKALRLCRQPDSPGVAGGVRLIGRRTGLPGTDSFDSFFPWQGADPRQSADSEQAPAPADNGSRCSRPDRH